MSCLIYPFTDYLYCDFVVKVDMAVKELLSSRYFQFLVGNRKDMFQSVQNHLSTICVNVIISD